MAKRNKKSSAKPKEGGNSTSVPHPTFDERALDALTSRIEEGFGEQKSQKGSAAQHTQHIENSSSSRAASSKGGKPELVKGSKRDANGNTKGSARTSGQKKQQQEQETRPSKKVRTEDRDVLLREIMALGGTEEDLDLVADAHSDDEDVPLISTPMDKSLQKELASFVSGLGIQGQVEDGEDEENESNEGEEEDWEDASTSGSPLRIGDIPEARPEQAAIAPPPASLDGPNRLIFEARPDWHAAVLPPLPNFKPELTSIYNELISSLKDYASTLLEADARLYASKQLSASSSHRFLSTIMASGTLSDKVSALTLVVQESPIHTLKSFDSLLNLARKRSRGQAVTALGALKDLLGAGSVLPADRRLRSFNAQPGLLATLEECTLPRWTLGQPLPGNITKAHLISWAYEDWLKEFYFEVLKILEVWCNDEVEYARSRAVTYVYESLKEKPEQEANLLRLLVNKLGDPDKKIASRTSYLILQLEVTHPLMKQIIIRSIKTELLLRPGQSIHAKYYAINTLNQTILSTKEEKVAKELLDIYFELFVSLLKKPDTLKPNSVQVVNRKGQIQGGGAPMGKKAKAKATKEEEAKLANDEMAEKMISAVLTGVNRAFPFSKADDLTLEEHMDTLFRITHSSNFNTSIQALMLIEQLSTSKHLAVDRFYRTLYESLLDPRLITSSKHALYLNLLFRSLRSDLNVKRVKAFAKRMLQVVTLHQPPFICGIIYLLRELEAIFPGLRTVLMDPQDHGDEAEEESFHDVPEDGIETTVTEPKHLSHAPVYDGKKRDPEYSNADKSCLWEIIPFLVHFHPSVALFANRLLDDEKMPPKPDLDSHTLSSFLDRFVYRNAKAASSGPRGNSIMQPLAGSDSRGTLLSSRGANRGQESLNSESFWRKKADEVAVDEVFFHKYFSQLGRSKQSSTATKASSKAGGEVAIDDEDNEDEIWEALVKSRPEVEGKSDDDSDMEMLDLDDSDAESLLGDVEMNSEEDEGEDGGVVFSEMEASGDLDEFDEDAAESDVTSEAGLIFADGKPVQQMEAKDGSGDSKRSKRKKMKNLPTFASVDDYADMINDEKDEDL